MLAPPGPCSLAIMDHLPYPNNDKFPPLEIPYVCGDILTNDQDQTEYINNIPSFADFSENPTDAVKYWQECDPERVAGEAQAPIYFGLLNDLLGVLFVLDDFVCISKRSSEPVITLVKLEEKFRFISQTIPLESFKGLTSRATYYAGMIRRKSPLAEKVSLSIDILAWSVVAMRDPQFALNTQIGGCVKDGILETRMLAAGWCPYWTKAFCGTYPAALTHYLTGLPTKFHSGHGACSESDCQGHSVDMEKGKYIPQHTNSDCGCAFKGPNTKDIETIIRAGGVPLIKLSETRQGDIEVGVVELGYGKPFIAISHVWSGGLGNPMENMVPSCQLKFIYKSAKKCVKKDYGKGIFRKSHEANVTWQQTKYYKTLAWLLGEASSPSVDQPPLEWYLELVDSWALSGANEDSNDVYIWFDTLCIPVAKNTGTNATPDKEMESFELKMKAINKMAFVYASAMHVLVIEQTTRCMVYRQAGDLELAALLLTSPWMSRCWTFQEACLARQFSFVLGDELIDPRKWISNIPTDRCSSILERILKYQCLGYLNSMPDVMNENIEARKEEHQSNLIAVWNALSSRSTTKREDLHGLLAIMVNLSAFEILQMGKAQRMLGIIRAQKKVPLSMLFLPYSQRTPLIQGCEWLPSYPSGALSERFGYMTWSTKEEGLQFVPSDTASILILVELGKHFERKLFLITVPGPDAVVVQVKLFLPNERHLSNCQTDTFGILLYGYHALTPTWDFQGVGACFLLNSAKSLEQQHIRMKFICPVEYVFWEANSKGSSPVQKSVPKFSDARGALVEQVEPGILCLLQCGQSYPSPHGVLTDLPQIT